LHVINVVDFNFSTFK